MLCIFQTSVTLERDSTDLPPSNPLHDEVLTGLQMFDDVFAQRGLGLDETLDHLEEVKGGQVEHVQYPGETHVCSGVVTSSAAVPSIFKAALYLCRTNKNSDKNT